MSLSGVASKYLKGVNMYYISFACIPSFENKPAIVVVNEDMNIPSPSSLANTSSIVTLKGGTV